MDPEPTPEAIEALYRKLEREAEAAGYHLNPDREFTRELVRGLLVNQARYGYPSCPCRLASGIAQEDLDIVCPCDYRDADLGEYGACYCGLYVSTAIARGEQPLRPVPERRPPAEARKGRLSTAVAAGLPSSLPFPVWRCRVCGYLCAREEPPEVCPICKARRERFERFL
jgi:ferredoxin-thioredoxin reductase catalytic subunit